MSKFLRKQTKIRKFRERNKKRTRRRKSMKGGAVLATQNDNQNAMIKIYGLENKKVEFIDTDGIKKRVSIYPTSDTFNIVDDDNKSAIAFLQYLEMPVMIVGDAPSQETLPLGDLEIFEGVSTNDDDDDAKNPKDRRTRLVKSSITPGMTAIAFSPVKR